MNKLHKPKTKTKKEKNMKEKRERKKERKGREGERERREGERDKERKKERKKNDPPAMSEVQNASVTNHHLTNQIAQCKAIQETVLYPGGYSTNIWVEVSHWGFETLTLFRTRKFLKYILCLGQTGAKSYTLLRTERTKTIPCPATHPRIGHIRKYPPGLGF